jgi:hypothetical protein
MDPPEQRPTAHFTHDGRSYFSHITGDMKVIGAP